MKLVFKRVKHNSAPKSSRSVQRQSGSRAFERTKDPKKAQNSPTKCSQDNSVESIVAEIKERNRLKTKIGGRPSKLTPKVQQKIVEAIRNGNYYEVACRYAGVSYDSFRTWMARGEQELLAIEEQARKKEENPALTTPSTPQLPSPGNGHAKFQRTKKREDGNGQSNHSANHFTRKNKTAKSKQAHMVGSNGGNGANGGNGKISDALACIPESRLVGNLSYGDFCLAVKKAEAEAEVRLVGQWQALLPTDWKAIATFLERRHPEKWGKRDSMELKGKGGGPVEFEHRHLIIQQIIQEPSNRELIADQWRKDAIDV